MKRTMKWWEGLILAFGFWLAGAMVGLSLQPDETEKSREWRGQVQEALQQGAENLQDLLDTHDAVVAAKDSEIVALKKQVRVPPRVVVREVVAEAKAVSPDTAVALLLTLIDSLDANQTRLAWAIALQVEIFEAQQQKELELRAEIAILKDAVAYRDSLLRAAPALKECRFLFVKCPSRTEAAVLGFVIGAAGMFVLEHADFLKPDARLIPE